MVCQNEGTPIQTPTHFDPYHGDPLKGNPKFGKPHMTSNIMAFYIEIGDPF